MLYRWWVYLLLLSPGLMFANSKPESNPSVQKQSTAQLPVTTSSPHARKIFETAMWRLEEYRTSEAVQSLRAAIQVDPSFAQALILISHLSHDPVEQDRACTRAKRLAAKVSPSERLLIRWMSGAQENQYLPAIAAMNDLLAAYPHDQRLAFLEGRWLIEQQRYEQAVVILERAVTLHPNYPAALNDLAYAHAYSGNFAKAFAAMDHYVALEPNEPNPHDSYGELLQMAGKFDVALEQYRISVRMDPNFGSQLGIADTYALMGREQDAREEYQRAIDFAVSPSDKIQYELQAALTWIRENNRKQAENSLAAVAKHAHAAGLGRLEAEADRALAMYADDLKSALHNLQLAEHALQDSHKLSQSDRDEEWARILRVRATRLAAEGRGTAPETVSQLKTMAENSRSQIIQLCYHGAAGAVSATQGKWAESIPHLEEDSADPLSMRLLWAAYSKTGDSTQAKVLASKLASFNLPTLEQALVVPQFRASLVSMAGQP